MKLHRVNTSYKYTSNRLQYWNNRNALLSDTSRKESRLLPLLHNFEFLFSTPLYPDCFQSLRQQLPIRRIENLPSIVCLCRFRQYFQDLNSQPWGNRCQNPRLQKCRQDLLPLYLRLYLLPSQSKDSVFHLQDFANRTQYLR